MSQQWSNLFKFQIVQIITIAVLVVSACQPSPGIPRATPEPSPDKAYPPTLTAVTQETDSGLDIVDNGAPLPPEVVAQEPLDGSEFPIDGEISLTFDQPMDRTKTGEAWQLRTSDGGVDVPGSITWIDSSKFTFAPNIPLEPGISYSASLSTDAASAESVQMSDSFQFKFSTVGPLQVSQVFPADQAEDAANNAAITVIFNRPVVPLVIHEEQSTLPQPLEITPTVPGKGEWINTSIYTFRPEPSLIGGTTYTATVEAGLQDAVGGSTLSEPVSWSFSTAAPAIDTFEISTGQVNPADNFENVLLDAYFTIRFLQPMS